MREWVGLALWIGVCLMAGAVGARYGPGIWYGELTKPPLTPPSWAFAPVWTLLYVMMAVAAWRVWRLKGAARHGAPLWWFGAQLLANGLWSWIFFGLQRPGWALLDLVLLILLLAVTTRRFFRLDRIAGALLFPYLGWVVFAAYLNFGIWWLNR